MSSRGWARPSSSRSRPPTLASPPPRSSIRRGMTSKPSVAPDSITKPRMPGSRFAPRVSMLWTSSQFRLGILVEELGQHAVAQQVGHLVEVARAG